MRSYLVQSKEKGARKITFDQFMGALKSLVTMKYPDESQEEAFSHIQEAIIHSQGPAVRGTEAKTGGIYDKVSNRIDHFSTTQLLDTFIPE